MDAIAALLQDPPADLESEVPDLDMWWARHVAVASAYSSSIDRAIAAGQVMDRIGYAFASGYQAALGALFDVALEDGVMSFSVTEEGGGHPRAIQTELVAADGGFRLTGKKVWATLSSPARDVFVVAREGEDSGRPKLAVVRVPLARDGITQTVGFDAPFVPEIGHGALSFDNVRVAESERLEGDGYTNYVKPFRTVEDIHVHASVIAYLTRTAWVAGWPAPCLTRALGILTSLSALQTADPSAPLTHVKLDDILSRSTFLLAEADELAPTASPIFAERYRRDRPLFSVAAKARKLRTEAAWQKLREADQRLS